VEHVTSNSNQGSAHSAVSANGTRFALAPASETSAAARQDKLVFVFNFFDELRRVAPPGR
jgi:hypothetical protein